MVEDEIFVGKAGHRFTAQTGRYNLCMQLPTQEQFVADCLSKYWFTDIPADQKWEAAHFPLPGCSGEGDTVLLWSADHTVQGLLQSVELDHQCFYHKANSKDLYNLEKYYPEYLPLFAQLKSQFSSRNGKKSAVTNRANGTGLYDPKIQLAGAKKGGKIGGKKTVEFKLGIHGQSAEQMTANGKKGGRKAAVTNKANGAGFFNSQTQSVNGKKGGPKASAITNAQKWQCLITGHISNPGGLSTYQRKRGIDTKLRVKIN